MGKTGVVSIIEEGKDFEKVVKEIDITDYVRAEFKDHRLCTVVRTEENTFVLAVENPASSGRNPLSQMHLTEESMLGLLNAIFLYYMHNNIDIEAKMKELVNSDNIEFEFNKPE